MTNDRQHIFAYTRKQAIEDGVLIDVSEMAKEAGFKYSTTLTSMLWQAAVAVPPDLEGEQDENGRLWDVLSMAAVVARQQRTPTDTVHFVVAVRNEPNRPLLDVRIKAVCGPGDDAKPVVTLMLPWEY